MNDKDLVCDSACEQCGRSYADGAPFVRCFDTKKIICRVCCQLCKEHRSYLLPNGTHCNSSYQKERYKYRLLNRPILAPPEEVAALVPKYEAEPSGILFEKFFNEALYYGMLLDEDKRARMRPQLAAMQKILKQRVLSEPRTKRLYERLNGIKEGD